MNQKVAIVADTSQDLTFELGERFNFHIVSYYVQMGDKHYKDLVEIDSRTFYETMEKYDTLSTGVPPIQNVFDLLDQLREQGYHQAVLICSSEKITGMHQLYNVVKSQYQGLDLHIFDTGTIGAAAGNFSIYAGELAQAGLTAEEIIDKLSEVKDNSSIHALFRTLKYLVRGGRFNKYKGILGMLLNINPLLCVDNGEIGVKDKVRGTKKSFNALIQSIRDEIGDSKKYRLIIFSGNNESELGMMRLELQQEIAQAELYLETEFTPVLGVHAGPKSIGAAILKFD